MIRYTIVYERVDDPSFPPEYYYAHVPALDITTHGRGIEGAKEAAQDLIKLWLAEKKANGEPLRRESGAQVSTIEIEEDALLG